MRQSILCFKEIVMRADSLSTLFNRDSHITNFWRNRRLVVSCQLCVDGSSNSIQQQQITLTARTTQAQESLLLSSNFRHFQIFSVFDSQAGLLSKFEPSNVGLRESVMTLKQQCGATRTKGPDREMLACENTTLRCNPHLELRQADCRKAGV